VKDFTPSELQAIIQQRQLPPYHTAVQLALQPRAACQQAASQLQAAAAEPLARLAAALNSSSSGGSDGGRLLTVTMREVMKILKRHVTLGLNLPDAVVSLLAPRVIPGSPAAQMLQQAIQGLGGVFSSVQLPSPEDYSISYVQSPTTGSPPVIRFAASNTSYVDVIGADLSHCSTCSNSDPTALPAALRAALVHIAFAVAAGEPVMLIGPTCYKSSVVTAWVEMTGQAHDLIKVHLSPGVLHRAQHAQATTECTAFDAALVEEDCA